MRVVGDDKGDIKLTGRQAQAFIAGLQEALSNGDDEIQITIYSDRHMMIRLLDMLNDVGNGGGGYSPDNPKARGEFIKMLVGVGPLFDGLLTYRYNTTKFDNNQGRTHFGVELEVWYKDFWGGEDFEWIQTITQKTGESTVVFNDPPVSDDPPGEFYYFYYTEKEKSDKILIQRRGQMDAYFYDGPARAFERSNWR